MKITVIFIQGGRQKLGKERRELSRVIEMLHILIKMVGPWVYTFVKLISFNL